MNNPYQIYQLLFIINISAIFSQQFNYPSSTTFQLSFINISPIPLLINYPLSTISKLSSILLLINYPLTTKQKLSSSHDQRPTDTLKKELTCLTLAWINGDRSSMDGLLVRSRMARDSGIRSDDVTRSLMIFIGK